MNCKLIVNRESGNCEKLDVKALAAKFECCKVQFIDSNSDWCSDGCDTVVVCGGDGTLHHAIEKCFDKKILYAPCGTLNEAALTEKHIDSIGRVNGNLFSYVCATGSFTEIGYKTQNRHKKKWKALAYLPQVLKSYRCHQIAAKMDVDGKIFQGDFTLIMVLKSHRCFGFAFNKDYKRTQKTYLLAVRSQGGDNLANRVKMFFPFFRIFFCGAKPQQNKNWLLLPFDNLTVTLDKPQDFCLDGEKQRLQGTLHFCTQHLDNPIEVIPTPLLK